MRQVTVNIPDNQYTFFIKLVKNLKFAEVEKPEEQKTEADLTPAQMKTWRNIKRGFEQMKMVEGGKMKTRPIQELLNEL